jgi:hypothetical protein
LVQREVNGIDTDNDSFDELFNYSALLRTGENRPVSRERPKFIGKLNLTDPSSGDDLKVMNRDLAWAGRTDELGGVRRPLHLRSALAEYETAKKVGRPLPRAQSRPPLVEKIVAAFPEFHRDDAGSLFTEEPPNGCVRKSRTAAGAVAPILQDFGYRLRASFLKKKLRYELTDRRLTGVGYESPILAPGVAKRGESATTSISKGHAGSNLLWRSEGEQERCADRLCVAKRQWCWMAQVGLCLESDPAEKKTPGRKKILPGLTRTARFPYHVIDDNQSTATGRRCWIIHETCWKGRRDGQLHEPM